MKRIGVFIDGSNLYKSAQSLGIRIDFTKLKKYYQGLGDVAQAAYFTALPPKDVPSTLRPLADFVEFNGFTLIQKETKEYYDSNTHERKLKGNMDVEIATYIKEVAHTLDDIVLYSGDGDFRYLIESVQRTGCHVTVVSTRALVADALRRQANEFVDLATLKDKFLHESRETPPAVVKKRFGFIEGK